MHHATHQFATAEYPVLSVVNDLPAANAPSPHLSSLDDARFLDARVREDGFALARLEGHRLDPRELSATALTPGFRVELRAERTRFGRAVIVGVMIERLDATADTCHVRFRYGLEWVDAAIATG